MLVHAAAGFAAGFVHVFAGPDHLAAVAPLAAGHERRRWRAGALWGLGHTGGVWLVGALSLALRGVLPVETLSSWGERLVGVVLIGLGVWALRRALTRRLHTHEHRHDGRGHVHIHYHGGSAAGAGLAHAGPRAHAHTHAAAAVGVLHGLAGSSHVLGILPALALPTLPGALAYIAAFGLGSIAAMSVFALAVASAAARLAGGALRMYRVLLVGCAGAAIAVGCWWLAASF
jgi:hypothetical protein